VPLLRPCRNTAAFELLPEHQGQLDLGAVESALAGQGYRRVVRAGVMLIMRAEVEVSVYRSGKVLIKTRDPDVATQIASMWLEVQGGLTGEPVDVLRTEGLERLQAERRGD
jgi:hypothetical protein